MSDRKRELLESSIRRMVREQAAGIITEQASIPEDIKKYIQNNQDTVRQFLTGFGQGAGAAAGADIAGAPGAAALGAGGGAVGAAAANSVVAATAPAASPAQTAPPQRAQSPTAPAPPAATAPKAQPAVSNNLKAIQKTLGAAQTGTWDKATAAKWTQWLTAARNKLEGEIFPEDLAINWKDGGPKAKIGDGNPATPFKGDYSGMLDFINAVNAAPASNAAAPPTPAAETPAAPSTPAAASSNKEITASIKNPGQKVRQGDPIIVNASYSVGGSPAPLSSIRALVYDSDLSEPPLLKINPSSPGGPGKKLYDIRIPTKKLEAGKQYIVRITATVGDRKQAVKSDNLVFSLT